MRLISDRDETALIGINSDICDVGAVGDPEHERALAAKHALVIPRDLPGDFGTHGRHRSIRASLDQERPLIKSLLRGEAESCGAVTIRPS